MSVPLRELLDAVAMPYRVVGAENREVSRAAGITEADEDSVTFCWKADSAPIRATRARVIVCSESHDAAAPDGKTLIVVSDPRLAFLRIVTRFFTPRAVEPGIHPTAAIEPGVEIGDDVHIGPFVSIARDCIVGEGSVLHAHVVLYPRTIVGRNVIVHAGTVLGADGFGYQRNERGEMEKFPHIGGVVIEDDVEIGSNTNVDRGTLGNTIVRQGARIDNQVHVGHNAEVGRHCAVTAHVLIGGSTKIGEGAWISPSACLRDGLTIGANAMIGLGAVVVKNVPDGATVMGVPARPAEEYKQFLKAAAKLIGEAD